MAGSLTTFCVTDLRPADVRSERGVGDSRRRLPARRLRRCRWPACRWPRPGRQQRRAGGRRLLGLGQRTGRQKNDRHHQAGRRPADKRWPSRHANLAEHREQKMQKGELLAANRSGRQGLQGRDSARGKTRPAST